MSNAQDRAAANRTRLLAALRELVEAVDRRVPQLEREGELRIAHEAASLREEAIRRIAELEAQEG